MKKVAIVLTFVSLALASYSVVLLTKPEAPSSEPLAITLKTVWASDIEAIRENKKADQLWSEIKEFTTLPGDKLAKSWLPASLPEFTENPDGKYKLETIVLGWEDEENTGAIVLYHLIDLNSGNLLWELGRTFILESTKLKAQKNPI